jgi:S1-C subfamily serine protease
MQQGDFIRAFTLIAAAGAGAGLALAGAAMTGHLDSSTTIQQIMPATSQAASALPSSSGLSVQQIYRLDAPGVVQINTSVPTSGLGSGFVLDEAGHIVTNNGVLSGARSVKVSFSGGDELDARVVGKDPTTDIAVLQVNTHSRSLSPLALGDSDLVQVGDPVVALGNTFALSRTATVGIVSAVQHGIDDLSGEVLSHSIQTDAAINPSNSGGPLVNTRGQVIGISSQTPPEAGLGAGATAGIGFAIPIDTVKLVVAQLLQTGKVVHPYLGIEVATVSPSLQHAFALPVAYGLLVESVTSGSSAAQAGLRAGGNPVAISGESYRLGGDIIVSAAGKPVTSEASLRNIIQSMKPGDTLPLLIWRGDKKETVDVKLGQPPG